MANLDIGDILYVSGSCFFTILSPGLNYFGREFLILVFLSAVVYNSECMASGHQYVA